MRSTDYGFWGTASVWTVFQFFRKVNLEKYDCFVDLGSGDGRVVLLASLFTDAVGVEGDEELVELSHEIREELGLDAEFHCEDFLDHDCSQYDCVFINPDKSFSPELEEKLSEEVEGHIYVYNKIYKPQRLEKGRTMWVEQLPIIKYRP